LVCLSRIKMLKKAFGPAGRCDTADVAQTEVLTFIESSRILNR
jgi:hypothetical protein